MGMWGWIWELVESIMDNVGGSKTYWLDNMYWMWGWLRMIGKTNECKLIMMGGFSWNWGPI
jgi:hypothetical protein